MTIEHIIQNIEIHYTALTEECKSDLIKVSKILTLDRETKIVKEGEHADKTYFIAQGSARAFYIKDGKDITD